MIEVHNPTETVSCPTCEMHFAGVEQHKLHYKSDLHRYNVKRKLVRLPPVTEQMFSTKRPETKQNTFESLQCGQCRKRFASLQTFNQHIASKKHNPLLKQTTTLKAATTQPQQSQVSQTCLFCQRVSESVPSNLQHMQSTHGFFIAQEEYCVDQRGLLQYLHEKINVGNMCIKCDNKGVRDFACGEAVRRHMVDRGHTFMKTEEGYEEYQNYYDFTRVFEEQLKQQGKVVPGIQFVKVKVIVPPGKELMDKVEADNEKEEGGEEDEDEWEDEEDEEELGEASQNKQENNEQTAQQNTVPTPPSKPQIKVYKIMKPTLTAIDQLLLPNGKLLGHRKYRYLYRQSYRQTPYLNNLKQLCAQPTSSLIARNKLLQVLKRQKMMRREYLRDTKQYVKNGVNNNALQHYFRIQNSM